MPFDDTLKNKFAAACPVYTDFKTTPDGQAVNFVNIWGLSRDPELWGAVIDWCADESNKHDIKHLFALEARGLHLAGATTLQSGIPFSPVRKIKQTQDSQFKSSIPGDILIGNASSEYTKAEFIGIEKQDLNGDKIAIIDDLLATGGSALGAATLAQGNNGNPVQLISPIYVDGLNGIENLNQRGIAVSYLITVDEIMDRREAMGLDRTRTSANAPELIELA